MLVSYGNQSSPSVHILRQQVEPDVSAGKGKSSKHVSITITPVQASHHHQHNETEVGGCTIETKGSRSEFEPKERLAQTQPYQNLTSVSTALKARTILDSSSIPTESLVNQQEFS